MYRCPYCNSEDIIIEMVSTCYEDEYYDLVVCYCSNCGRRFELLIEDDP